MELLDKIIENCKQQILSGVLLKNVTRGLLNDGLSQEMADKITRISELEANEFLKLKSK